MSVKERILEAKKQRATGTSALSDFPPKARQAIEQRVGKNVRVERYFYGRDLRAALHANPKEGTMYAISSGYDAKNVFAVIDPMMHITITGPVPKGVDIKAWGTQFTASMDKQFGSDGWSWFLIQRK